MTRLPKGYVSDQVIALFSKYELQAFRVYFDTSMDYIYARTDDSRGKLNGYKPEALKEKTEKNEELRQFVELCFDQDCPMSGRLKETMFRMLNEEQ